MKRAFIFVLLAFVITSCAARGPRAKAQVASVATAEGVFVIDDAEWTVWNAKVIGYTQADHLKVGDAIRKLHIAALAFETAARAWPKDGSPTNAAVEQATTGLAEAFAEVERVLPAAGSVRKPLLAAIASAKAAYDTWRAQ